MDVERLLAAVWEALGEVVDPELGLPITDLGLVYDVRVDGGRVEVDMTTTTPVCPLGSHLARLAESRVAAVPGVTAVELRVVHEPAWTPDRLSNRARRVLGLRGE
ncbi:MAG TPA: metal-sulfur cluster assembly factor [Actinobacteria bacterium]|nr:metal-sulfur cluster assembly factor [Actinomycetota bacterium]